MRINKGDLQFCTGCTMKIFLAVEDAGSYVVMAKTSLGVPTLMDGFHYDDVADYNEQNCYKYQAFEPETTLQLRLTVYSGEVIFYMNPKERPVNSEAAAYLPLDQHDNTIILTSEDRNSKGKKGTGLYYICVESLLASTYTLIMQELPKDQSYHILESGYTEKFKVKGNSHKQFIYKIPESYLTDDDIDVAIEVTKINGQELGLFGRVCETEDLEACLVQDDKELEEQIKNEALEEGYNSGTMNKLVLNHDETKCKREKHGHCYYLIVVENNFNKDSAEFKIMASHV